MAVDAAGSCRFGLARTHIITIAGWSPGVRALATSQPLPCGCLVGVYHTWSENVVALIDAVGDHCRQHHDINLVLWRWNDTAEHRVDLLDPLRDLPGDQKS